MEKNTHATRRAWLVEISHRSGFFVRSIITAPSRLAAEMSLYMRPDVPVDASISSRPASALH